LRHCRRASERKKERKRASEHSRKNKFRRRLVSVVSAPSRTRAQSTRTAARPRTLRRLLRKRCY
jgi:hypothetical protein